MDAWLAVELAATDAWAEEVVPRPQPVRERASFEVEAVEERSAPPATTSPRSSTSSPPRSARRTLDPLRTHLLRTSSTPRSRSRSRRRADPRWARPAYRDALAARALEHATPSASAGPTASTPSRPPSGSAGRLRLRGRARTSTACDAPRGRRVGNLGGGRGLRLGPAGSRPRRSRAGLGARTSRPRSCPATATPRCSTRSRSPGGGSSGSPPGPRPPADRGRRGRRRAFRSGQKGPPRCLQEEPDHLRELWTGLARLLRGYAGKPALRTSRSGTSAHLALVDERVAMPDATILSDFMLGARDRPGEEPGRPRRPHARQPRAHRWPSLEAVLLGLVAKGVARQTAYVWGCSAARCAR